jgi:Flp pilus assembly protein TadG
MRTPSKRARQGGGAAVEFGLVLTLLISILAGIYGFGRAFWYYDALTKASRDAARAMSVSAKATIFSAGVTAAQDIVVTAANDAGVPGFSAANVSVTCLDVNFANGAACADNNKPGAVRVEIVDYTMSVGQYIPFLLGATSTYSTKLAPGTTMRYMLP